jgi:phosphoribosylformylglycinamidine cyclo-ligase
VDYKAAGVDIKNAEQVIKLSQTAIRETYNNRVVTGLGAFGGVIRVPGTNLVYITSIDGVGTRLKVG